MGNSIYIDEEFGEIQIQKRRGAKYVRVRVSPDGTIRASLPYSASKTHLIKLIESSRTQLRSAFETAKQHQPPLYKPGMPIGKAHRIILRDGASGAARLSGQDILWTIPPGTIYTDANNQSTIRKAVRRALDEQARSYLPRRLEHLAAMMSCEYRAIRYANQKGRWGSCSSSKVISLNVALMNLPSDLIDYVLIHELSHTKHLNHSTSFWGMVATYYPSYKSARKELKSYSPYL